MVNKITFFILVGIIALLPSGIIISFILLLIYYGKPILESLGIHNDNHENRDDESDEFDWEYAQTFNPSDLDRFWHPTWGFSKPKNSYDSKTRSKFR